jgi:hypothetical protein
MAKEYYKKEREKAERIISKIEYWDERYNNCHGLSEEFKMDISLSNWKNKGVTHIEYLQKVLGNLRVCIENDLKRLEIAKILMLYQDNTKLNLEGFNSSQPKIK